VEHEYDETSENSNFDTPRIPREPTHFTGGVRMEKMPLSEGKSQKSLARILTGSGVKAVLLL